MLWAQQPGYNAGGSYPIPVQQQQQQHMRAANQPIAGLQQDEVLQKTPPCVSCHLSICRTGLLAVFLSATHGSLVSTWCTPEPRGMLCSSAVCICFYFFLPRSLVGLTLDLPFFSRPRLSPHALPSPFWNAVGHGRLHVLANTPKRRRVVRGKAERGSGGGIESQSLWSQSVVGVLVCARQQRRREEEAGIHASIDPEAWSAYLLYSARFDNTPLAARALPSPLPPRPPAMLLVPLLWVAPCIVRRSCALCKTCREIWQ